jgi:hypothetical protein
MECFFHEDETQCLDNILVDFERYASVSCLVYSSTLKIEAIYSPKRRLTFNRLHAVISQKTELFKTSMGRQILIPKRRNSMEIRYAALKLFHASGQMGDGSTK